MHNSTAVIGDQNSSKTELILNTNACNAGFSLDDFVTASDETNRLYQLKKRSVFPTTGKAMMTREELFECDTLEDDRFLTALEYQHTYGQPVIVTDLDQSIEDMLKYFNNGVVATHNSTNSTPTKLNTPTVSKVASAVANFRIKAANFTTSSLGRKKMKKPQTSPKVKELKQKYEPAEDLTDIIKPPDSKQPKSTKTPKKSKVKQITKMFNSKITQIMRRDSDNYSPLQNELSPEPKPTPEPLLVAPVAKPRTNRGVFSPVPTARSRHNKVPKSPDHTCLVAEDVFRQLSVKDRVLLYNKFFDDMSTKNPEFGKLAEDMKAKVRKQLTRGEVVNEKQQLVKQLAQELEAKCSISKSTTSFKTVQRMNSANEPKQRAPTPPTQQSSPKAKEGDDLLVPVDQISISDDDHEDLQHVSKLSVVLISSLADAKKNVLPPRPRSRKQRDNRYLHEMCIIEPSHKRSIQSIRSSLPHEAYAPPKKIRRTRMERLAPKMFFESQDMERLFYSWLKEKNGVSFDITATNNDSETIQIASDLESLANSMDNEHQKSAVDRLLEEALAKLEKVEIVDSKEEKADAVEEKEVDTMKSLVTDAFTNDVSIQQSVVVVELPMEIAIAAPLTQAPNIIPRKIKNLPPPVPSPRTLKISESSASSSAKQSEGDDSESGLSSLAKPPENELQKSHDHNPATLSEHQLRVQASLQRLNIPDWYQKYNQQTSRSPDGGNAYKPGNFTRKRTTESGRWAGLNSKTTSLSSLGSQRSDRSPLLLSPSAHSHHGGGANATAVGGAHQHHQHHAGGGGGTGAYGTGGAGSFSRWSTSHLNSSQTSPSVSQRGSFSRGGPVNSSFMSVASGNSAVIRNSFRQPYLGWRSTEKLSQRTPHERLASSLLAQQQRTSPTQRTIPSANGGDVGTKQLQAVTPEIQTSIKEVTSAIVHFVNDQTNQQRSRSTSPNSRKCWLESSFVGTRPLDSPQTPVIESTNTFSSATASCNNNNNNNSISSAYLNSSANSSIHSHILNQAVGGGAIAAGGVATNAAEVLRMNGSSCVGGGGAPERSLSTASLEDVLASLLGLPSTSSAGTTDGASANETLVSYRQQQQQHMPQQQLQQQQLLVNQTQAEQQRLRRRSEGDAPTKQQKQQQSKQEQQSHAQQQNATPTNSSAAAATTTSTTASNTARRVSLGDSSESTTACGNHAAASSVKQPNANATSELPIKCRNTKCDRSATAADAKKHYKSCHNCTHLYCTRECRRAHWEKHRKACLHARASNLCRQVLATCKDDLDSQRHLSVLARKGYLAQGRGVVRVLFRSAESAEGFIKHGFQCMGEASYVRWPDLMPAEMGLELYSELLKLSTEYKPDSKMLIYVAICVVSEAPGMGQAPVRWERQLVSRCAKLKLCKTVLGELDQQQAQVISQQPSLAVVAVIPEPTTEILILTFNPALKPSAAQRELILSNILDILSRRGVLLRKHYPEIYQRLQSYSEGQTDKFNPVTLHPRDSHSGQGFVCIIMPVHSDSEIIKLPSAADGGNRVTTIDVGSPAALAQFDDDELLTRSTSTS